MWKDITWKLDVKKNLDQSVSSLDLDDIYENAISAGAEGGKLLGAGGGGYFLFVANPSKKNKLIKSLKKLKYIDFNFTTKGTEIIKI